MYSHSGTLNLNFYSTLFLLPPEIAGLNRLKILTLGNSPVRDLSPIANLTSLEELRLDDTLVDNLAPIANMTKMQDAAVQMPAAMRGLFYNGTPIARKPPFDLLVRLDQPARTVETINEVRRQQGLPPHIPLGYKRPHDFSLRASIEPLPNIPSPFGFQVVAGHVRLASSRIDWPVFPFPTSKRDHESRLETSRTLAKDLATELKEGRFNARPDYADSLAKYANRLPERPGDGNILLADAEVRSLRNMFAADAESLSIGLASKLKTVLEQHIGLRVYYPEIEHFYRDVQNGRIETPLSLDAVAGFVRGVSDHSPEVFDFEVRDAVGTVAEREPQISLPPPATQPASGPDLPKAPRDPLGELDFQKARDFTFAGSVNALWKAFREGEKVHHALEGWKSAGEVLEPYVRRILEWLSNFGGSGA